MDTIALITDTEKQASALTLAAEARGKEIIAQAERDAQKYISEKQESLKEARAQTLAAQKDSLKEQYKMIREKGLSQKGDLEKAIERNMDAAVKLVLSKI